MRRQLVGWGLPHRIILIAAACLVSAAAVPCTACFSIVVGKNASTDGCVLVGHNENDAGSQLVNHHKVPRQTHPPGATVKLRNGGSLEQVPQTWSFIWSEMPGLLFSDSYLNEWGVTVCSNKCPSREDRPELSDGGIGYMLRRLVAERARTAREGVLLAGRLVEQFGYIDSGRTYIIADPSEGWLLCAINGKHWLAQRVPDNEVAMAANTYTVRTVDLKDDRNVLASKDIVDYARSRGWYDANSEAFDFAAVYSNPTAASGPNNVGRQWSGLKCITDKPLRPGPDLPFSVVPKQKLSVTDVMRILRHDKENEPNPSAPASPFICELCSGATQTSFVAQLRKTPPADIGLVYWVCLASPRTSFYIPFHFGITDFPAGWRQPSEKPTDEVYTRRVQGPFTADPQEAFWVYSNFRDKVDKAGPAMVARVKSRAEFLERRAVATRPAMEDAARQVYETDKATAMRLLENYSRGLYLSSLETMSALLEGE